MNRNAQLQYDNMSPDEDDEQRDDEVARIAAGLTVVRMKDERLVREALEAIDDGESQDQVLTAMAAFTVRFSEANTDASMAQAGLDLWRTLYANAHAAILADAESDAAEQYDRACAQSWQDAAEARHESREE